MLLSLRSGALWVMILPESDGIKDVPINNAYEENALLSRSGYKTSWK